MKKSGLGFCPLFELGVWGWLGASKMLGFLGYGCTLFLRTIYLTMVLDTFFVPFYFTKNTRTDGGWVWLGVSKLLGFLGLHGLQP